MYNKEQLDAINYFDGPLRIIAGAGSGKTKVITAKISKIIKEKIANEWQVLAITFTNKAANEMKHRVEQEIGYKPMCQISTYHSLCLRILRFEAENIGMDKNFTVIDENDKKDIVKSILNTYPELKFDKLPKVMKFIHSLKASRCLPTEVSEELKDNQNVEDISKIYEMFMKRLSDNHYYDFDDLIYLVDESFTKYPEVAEKWALKYKYIFVDEFQDTDNTQYSILKKLTKYGMLIVVGDPDQTIYTWRGANAKIINSLDKHYPTLKTIILNQNYRSTQQILDVANSVISKNKNRVDKLLFSEKSKGQLPYYYLGFSADDESRWVAHSINWLISNGSKLSDIAILFRAAYMSRSVEQRLVSNNLKYFIYGGVRFMERAEIKDAIAYLKVFLKKDEQSLERIINVPSRKIGNSSIAKLWTSADNLGTTFYDIVFNNSESHGSAKNAIASFRKIFDDINTNQKLSGIMTELLEKAGYLQILQRPSNESRMWNYRELVTWMDNFFNENPNATHDDFFQETSLISGAETEDNDAITLMTIHAAKGLEFKNVFIIGLNEGMFPSERAINERGDAIEEERRLFYVASTRAEEMLFMSSHAGRTFSGELLSQSRFIYEIDTGLTQKAQTHEARKSIDTPSTFKMTNIREKFIDYQNGDMVNHEVFGEGVILNAGPDIVQIAFKKPHGVKMIKKQHKALSKL